MIDKKTFKKAINEPFEKAGFLKKGQTWYFDGKDVLAVANIQKNDWGESYYINIGFWLKPLGKSSFTPVNQCHLSFRAESLFPDMRELILLGTSLEENNLEILTNLAQFIANDVIPFLKDCTDINKLSKTFDTGSLNNGLIFKEARQYLLNYKG